jgi:hypothetical protein
VVSPALALDPLPRNGGGPRLDLKVVLPLVVYIATTIYTYGELNAKVDALHEQVQQLRVEINQLRERH